ncbi:MAG: class I tRNA ligase family protein [Acidobacteriaceae bacterium]|nr:class I tRNA ligase family protein [Acidobacteriaceae bacterium]
MKNRSPYRECATHGWTLDADGRAMSKSIGNIIEPEEIVSTKGADILRLWVASVDFTEDVRMSELVLDRLSEAYRKLRNTFRWMLGNLGPFDPERDGIAGDALTGVDAWILVRAEELVKGCLEYYSQYAFHKVYRAVYDFATTDLSAVYFDVAKDRLYTAGPQSLARRSAQTALYRLNLALVRLLAPILSFTSEEVWKGMKSGTSGAESVHIAYFPEPADLTDGLPAALRNEAGDWEKLIPVRDLVLKALDSAREDKVIGSSLESAATLLAGSDLYELLQKHLAELPGWFIVSQVELHRKQGEGLEVQVERARGDKCERCWKFTTDVGQDQEVPTVCAACASVLRNLAA